MLNKTAQTILLSKLRSPQLRATTDAFDLDVVKAITGAPPREGLAKTTCLMVDIAGFSSRVAQLQPAQLRTYLKEFYAHAIKAIDDHHGLVDRIIGDAIVAVFTPFMSPQLTDATANQHAIAAAEEIVIKFAHTDRNSKVALSHGDVLFCKTGLEGVYTDYTALGNPLTHVYRIEEVAAANQIVVPLKSPLGSAVAEPRTVPYSTVLQMPTWHVALNDTKLRGAEDLGPLVVKTYSGQVIRRG